MKGPSVAAAIPLLACLSIGILAGQPAPPGAPAATHPAPPPTTQKADATYAITRTVQIPGEGAWDPWSYTPVTLDDQGKLLYISRGARTQVLDVASGKLVAEINSGPDANSGAIALVPDAGRGFITDSHNNAVTVFDLKTHAVLGHVPVVGVPASIAYDPMSKRVFVGCDPDFLVPIAPDIDLKSGKPADSIQLDGAPRGMVADGQGMLYVCIYDHDEVSVIDTRVMRIATNWPVDEWNRPAGLALDRLRSRLFVGCRSKIVVLSSVDGHNLGEVTVAGRDAWVGLGCIAFHDGKIFANCAEGVLSVVGQNPSGAFEVQQRIPIPKASWSIAMNPQTQAFYFPASDPTPGPSRRWGAGIKLVVLEKK